jgi:hypothetical protein
MPRSKFSLRSREGSNLMPRSIISWYFNARKKWATGECVKSPAGRTLALHTMNTDVPPESPEMPMKTLRSL